MSGAETAQRTSVDTHACRYPSKSVAAPFGSSPPTGVGRDHHATAPSFQVPVAALSQCHTVRPRRRPPPLPSRPNWPQADPAASHRHPPRAAGRYSTAPAVAAAAAASQRPSRWRRPPRWRLMRRTGPALELLPVLLGDPQ